MAFWEISLNTDDFVGDTTAQLATYSANKFTNFTINDNSYARHHGNTWGWLFTADWNQAIVSKFIVMPEAYAGGANVFKADLRWTFNPGVAASNVRWEVYVESWTPAETGVDVLQTPKWDIANVTTTAVNTSPFRPMQSIVNLTAKDSIIALDSFRIGIRRDPDHVDDTSSAEVVLYAARLYEEA